MSSGTNAWQPVNAKLARQSSETLRGWGIRFGKKRMIVCNAHARGGSLGAFGLNCALKA